VHEKNGARSIVWVDSLSAPARPTWEDVHANAIERYRSGAGQRALDAKQAELDSMLAKGWSVDSLAQLWGGLQHIDKLAPGKELPGLGRLDLDSLINVSGPGALRPGVMSSWVQFPFGAARIRVAETEAPNPEQLAARIETERRTETERNLEKFYSSLKTRYPVKILDPDLNAIVLPEVPGR
jgi:hypothetical protein